MPACLPANIRTSIHPSIHACMHACMHTDIQTYRHTDIQTYRHTDIQTSVHPCIHTYIHTYILTYIHNTYGAIYISKKFKKHYTYMYIYIYTHGTIQLYIMAIYIYILWQIPSGKLCCVFATGFRFGIFLIKRCCTKHGNLHQSLPESCCLAAVAGRQVLVTWRPRQRVFLDKAADKTVFFFEGKVVPKTLSFKVCIHQKDPVLKKDVTLEMCRIFLEQVQQM